MSGFCVDGCWVYCVKRTVLQQLKLNARLCSGDVWNRQPTINLTFVRTTNNNQTRKYVPNTMLFEELQQTITMF